MQVGLTLTFEEKWSRQAGIQVGLALQEHFSETLRLVPFLVQPNLSRTSRILADFYKAMGLVVYTNGKYPEGYSVSVSTAFYVASGTYKVTIRSKLSGRNDAFLSGAELPKLVVGLLEERIRADSAALTGSNQLTLSFT